MDIKKLHMGLLYSLLLPVQQSELWQLHHIHLRFKEHISLFVRHSFLTKDDPPSLLSDSNGFCDYPSLVDTKVQSRILPDVDK